MQDRHSRQIRFQPFGQEAQNRLARSHVLLVGVGALGTHSADTLVRAGIGRLTLVDRDVVDWSNLQRQSLFDAEDARVGRPKVDAAVRALGRLEAATELVARTAEFDRDFFDREFGDSGSSRPDLVLDGTDNFDARFLINDLCLRDGLPWIHAAAVGAEARGAVFVPGEGPCFRCLLDEEPSDDLDTCETVGVLEPAVAMATAFQTGEALKLLGGRPEAVTRGLFVADLWRGRFDLLFGDSGPRPGCASCGRREFPSLARPQRPLASLCGRNAVQVRPRRPVSLSLEETAARLERAGLEPERQPQLLRFFVDEEQKLRMSLFADGRALVVGTSDPLRAKSFYDRFLGL